MLSKVELSKATHECYYMKKEDKKVGTRILQKDFSELIFCKSKGAGIKINNTRFCYTDI